MWDVYNGKSKSLHQREVSIFIFRKKQLEEIEDQEQREKVLARLRLEPRNLARFRHPKILALLENLKEDSNSMVFVTERVKC